MSDSLLKQSCPTKRLKNYSFLSGVLIWCLFIIYLPIGTILLMLRIVVLFIYFSSSLIIPAKVNHVVGRYFVIPFLGIITFYKNMRYLDFACKQGQPFLIATNHCFYLDSVVIGQWLRSVNDARYGIVGSVLLGGEQQWDLLEKLGLVAKVIKTHSFAATAEQKSQTLKDLDNFFTRSHHKAPFPLYIAPEGTVHSCAKFLLRFEKHTFGLSTPVLPIALSIWQPLPLWQWTTRGAIWVNWFVILLSPFTCYHAEVLPLIEFENESDPAANAKIVQRNIASVLGVEASDIPMKKFIEYCDNSLLPLP